MERVVEYGYSSANCHWDVVIDGGPEAKNSHQ